MAVELRSLSDPKLIRNLLDNARRSANDEFELTGKAQWAANLLSSDIGQNFHQTLSRLRASG
jgi:hypothetical protein